MTRNGADQGKLFRHGVKAAGRLGVILVFTRGAPEYDHGGIGL